MEIDFEKGGGMLPAVVQEPETGRILMLGYMNREALSRTLATGNVTFFSRSRNRLWVKGESSGHVLKLREVLVDCDGDALVVVAEQLGPGTCHEGYRSCFYRRIEGDKLVAVEPRAFNPAAVYGAAPEASAAGKPRAGEKTQ